MRSLLFVPADSERKLARGLESGADALILDLEDSVAAGNRPTARKLAREFLEAHGPRSHPPLCADQPVGQRAGARRSRRHGRRPARTASCCRNACRTTCAPLDHYLSAFEAAAGAPVGDDPHHRDRDRDAAGRVRARRLCRGVAAPRGDHLGRRGPCRPASAAATARSTAITTARTSWRARCACWRRRRPESSRSTRSIPISGTRPGSRPNAPRRGVPGFAAKMAIHPAQLAAINEAFSVSAAERDWAERVIAAVCGATRTPARWRSTAR